MPTATDTNGVLERQLFDMDLKYTDLKTHLVQLRKQYTSTMASLQQQQQSTNIGPSLNPTQRLDGRQGLGKEGSTELYLGSPAGGSMALKKQLSMNSQQYENDFEEDDDDDVVENGRNHRDLVDHSDVFGVMESATRTRNANHQRRNRPHSANAAVLSVNTTHGMIRTTAFLQHLYILLITLTLVSLFSSAHPLLPSHHILIVLTISILSQFP